MEAWGGQGGGSESGRGEWNWPGGMGGAGRDHLGGGPGFDTCIDYDPGAALRSCEQDRKARSTVKASSLWTDWDL